VFKAFVETIKDQVKKSSDLQQGVKSLQDESGKVYDSEALKKARELYEKAKVCVPCPMFYIVGNRNLYLH
jgi:import inner membrane translocase subunit TIM44